MATAPIPPTLRRELTATAQLAGAGLVALSLLVVFAAYEAMRRQVVPWGGRSLDTAVTALPYLRPPHPRGSR